jgi:ABC-type nitrate/sulfonate/bicarbonate transport system substrate-binding protein
MRSLGSRSAASVGVAALLLLALALGGLTVGAGAQDSTIKLVFPTPPVPFYLPYFVAKDLGWLDKAGIKMDELWLLGDSNAIKAVLGGSGDIAATGVFAAYTAVAEGAKIKAFASWQPTVDYVVIANKKIATYKDLKGATIGTGPGRGDIITEIFNLLVKKHGVDASTVKMVSIGGHEARMKAVAAKKTDVTLVGELFAAKSREFADVHAIGRIADEFPNIGYVYLVAGDDALRRKAALLEKFVKIAVIEGSRYVVQNPDGAVEVLRKRIADVDPAILKEVVHKLAEKRLFGVNGGLDPTVTEYTLRLAGEIGLLAKPVRADEVIDATIVKKVTAEVGPFR